MDVLLLAGGGERVGAFACLGDADDFPSSGRVMYDSAGAPLGVIEVFDIAKMQLLLALRRMTADRVVPADEAEQLAVSYLGQEGKASARTQIKVNRRESFIGNATKFADLCAGVNTDMA